MKRPKELMILILCIFVPFVASAATLPAPFVADKPLEIEGVVKDAADLKYSSVPVTYEIPAYGREGSGYVKYGIFCQRKGETRVIFADEGYLSSFVKSNAVDKPVLAKGKIIDGTRIAGLPKGMVFIIDSLRLEE